MKNNQEDAAKIDEEIRIKKEERLSCGDLFCLKIELDRNDECDAGILATLNELLPRFESVGMGIEDVVWAILHAAEPDDPSLNDYIEGFLESYLESYLEDAEPIDNLPNGVHPTGSATCPAFPVAADVNPDGNQSGMRLMDYFAAQALTALIQRDTAIAIHEISEAEGKPRPPSFYGCASIYDELSKEAYCIARAMIEGRMRYTHEYTHEYIAETLRLIAVPVEDYLLGLEAQSKELVGSRSGNLIEKCILETRERLERVRELEKQYASTA
jgi:hypothetical protein